MSLNSNWLELRTLSIRACSRIYSSLKILFGGLFKRIDKWCSRLVILFFVYFSPSTREWLAKYNRSLYKRVLHVRCTMYLYMYTLAGISLNVHKLSKFKFVQFSTSKGSTQKWTFPMIIFSISIFYQMILVSYHSHFRECSMFAFWLFSF